GFGFPQSSDGPLKNGIIVLAANALRLATDCFLYSGAGDRSRFAFNRTGALMNDDLIATVGPRLVRQRRVGHGLPMRLLCPVSCWRGRNIVFTADLVQGDVGQPEFLG